MDRIMAEIVTFIAGFHSMDVGVDDRLVDAGYDSIQAEELGAFLELKFGVPAQGMSLRERPTVRDLAAWVVDAGATGAPT